MLILAIDSTSYMPRVALIKDSIPLCEINQTSRKIVWDDFRAGDGSYIITEFKFQLQKLWKEVEYNIEDIDLICYSGYSGFQKIIEQGKQFSEFLGKKYGISIQSVDHITAHDISTFIQQDSVGKKFPILIFSASGSHNSFSLFQSKYELIKLGDTTEFDDTEKKYIGLGSIFFRLIKSLGLFDTPSGSNNIAEIISTLKYKTNKELIDFVVKNSKNEDLYSLKLKDILDQYQKQYYDIEKYSVSELYFSFQEAIIQLCIEKFLKIYQKEQFKEFHIVGGIAMNDLFFDQVKAVFEKIGVNVYRPKKEYRFDNATMLGVLAYYIYAKNAQYDFSNIVT